jgi:hypothetical protein
LKIAHWSYKTYHLLNLKNPTKTPKWNDMTGSPP